MKTRTSAPIRPLRRKAQHNSIHDLHTRFLHAERRLRDVPARIGRVYLGHNRDTGRPFLALMPIPSQTKAYPRAELNLTLTTTADPPGLVLEVAKPPEGLSRDAAEEEVRAALSDMTELLDILIGRPEVMDCLLGPQKHFRRRTAIKRRAHLKRLALYGVGILAASVVVVLGALCSAFNFAFSVLPFLAR